MEGCLISLVLIYIPDISYTLMLNPQEPPCVRMTKISLTIIARLRVVYLLLNK